MRGSKEMCKSIDFEGDLSHVKCQDDGKRKGGGGGYGNPFSHFNVNQFINVHQDTKLLVLPPWFHLPMSFDWLLLHKSSIHTTVGDIHHPIHYPDSVCNLGAYPSTLKMLSTQPALTLSAVASPTFIATLCTCVRMWLLWCTSCATQATIQAE